MAVDATDCLIERPSEWQVQKIFYNGHKKKHCLKYEIGVNWVNGFICWIAGPIPGRYHDITLCRTYGIVANRDLLQDGELCWADKGYVGEDLFVTPFKNPSTDNQLQWNHWVHSHRWIVENVLERLKNFKCLAVRWRHDRALHPVAFKVIASLINLEMYFHPVRQ
jgi:hypothetical protein